MTTLLGGRTIGCRSFLLAASFCLPDLSSGALQLLRVFDMVQLIVQMGIRALSLRQSLLEEIHGVALGCTQEIVA